MDGLLQLHSLPPVLQCEKGDFNKDVKDLQDANIKQIKNTQLNGIQNANPKIKCKSSRSREFVYYYLGSIGRTFFVGRLLSVEETLVFLKKEHDEWSIAVYGKFSPCKSEIPVRYNAFIRVENGVTSMNARHSFPFDYNNWAQFFMSTKISDKSNGVFHRIIPSSNNTLYHSINTKNELYTSVGSKGLIPFTVPQVLNVANNSRSGNINIDRSAMLFNNIQLRRIDVNGDSNCRNFVAGLWFSTLEIEKFENKKTREEAYQIMNVFIDAFRFTSVILCSIYRPLRKYLHKLDFTFCANTS